MKRNLMQVQSPKKDDGHIILLLITCVHEYSRFAKGLKAPTVDEVRNLLSSVYQRNISPRGMNLLIRLAVRNDLVEVDNEEIILTTKGALHFVFSSKYVIPPQTSASPKGIST